MRLALLARAAHEPLQPICLPGKQAFSSPRVARQGPVFAGVAPCVTNNTIRHEESTIRAPPIAVRWFLHNKTRFSWHSAGIRKKDYDPCSGGIEYAVLRRCRCEIIAAAKGRRLLTLVSPFHFRQFF